MTPMQRMNAALNRLCKWRMVLTGWHLGTKGEDEPGVAAMRNLQDFRLVVRAELTALTAVLLEKGVITLPEFHAAVAEEAIELEALLQRDFPGYRAADRGMVINTEIALETNQAKRFPP